MSYRAGFLLAIMLGCAQAAGTNGDLFQAVRNGDLALIRNHVTKTNVDARGARGATLLMHAAAFGNLETMRFLIEAGADVNAKNDFGATALLWAARDPEKAKLLIAHQADVNAQSKQGRTPLMMAVQSDGSGEVVALLLAKGARVDVTDARGESPLSLAAQNGDPAIVRMLLDKGADVENRNQFGESPLIAAAKSRNPETIRLLLAKGAAVNTSTTSAQMVKNGQLARVKLTPLHNAANFGPAESVRTLLKAGADVNARDVRKLTPLMFAVAAESQDPETVRALLAAGADVNARSEAGETALDWAEKFKYPEVVQILTKAGAVHGNSPVRPSRPESPKPDAATVIRRSIALLQKSNRQYFIRSGCVGCHHQPLIARALQAARGAGLSVDEDGAREQTAQLKAQWASSQEEFLQSLNPGGGPNRLAESLLGLASSGVPADTIIDSAVVDVLESQRADGHWITVDEQLRPPITESVIAGTARAVSVLRAYSIPARKAEFEARIARARAWLKAAKPQSTEDYTMRLLGLSVAGGVEADIRQAARDLLALQRPDGGWAGNPYLESDAFATSGALFALRESGAMGAGDAAYRRGVDYLLRTQYPDGSWYVSSRSLKFQPYFESGFPFGHDQWISAAATAWAVVAVAPAIQPATSNRAPLQD